MYRDRTLLPKEAMRLAVLGTLALDPLSYADLATALRHFISRLVGPSLEFTGSSLELYRLEGLIAAEGGGAGKPGPDTRLALTGAGRAELRALLESGVRSPFDGVARLVLALKMRFLHLLDVPRAARTDRADRSKRSRPSSPASRISARATRTSRASSPPGSRSMPPRSAPGSTGSARSGTRCKPSLPCPVRGRAMAARSYPARNCLASCSPWRW